MYKHGFASWLGEGGKRDILPDVCHSLSLTPQRRLTPNNDMWTIALFSVILQLQPLVRIVHNALPHFRLGLIYALLGSSDTLLWLPPHIQWWSEVLWGRKGSSVTYLFFVDRYLPMAGHIPGVVKFLGHWSQYVSTRDQTLQPNVLTLHMLGVKLFTSPLLMKVHWCLPYSCRIVQLYNEIFLVVNQSLVVGEWASVSYIVPSEKCLPTLAKSLWLFDYTPCMVGAGKYL